LRHLKQASQKDDASSLMPSPIRAIGDEPLVEALQQVGPDHYVARHRIAGMF